MEESQKETYRKKFKINFQMFESVDYTPIRNEDSFVNIQSEDTKKFSENQKSKENMNKKMKNIENNSENKKNFISKENFKVINSDNYENFNNQNSSKNNENQVFSEKKKNDKMSYDSENDNEKDQNNFDENSNYQKFLEKNKNIKNFSEENKNSRKITASFQNCEEFSDFSYLKDDNKNEKSMNKINSENIEKLSEIENFKISEKNKFIDESSFNIKDHFTENESLNDKISFKKENSFNIFDKKNLDFDRQYLEEGNSINVEFLNSYKNDNYLEIENSLANKTYLELEKSIDNTIINDKNNLTIENFNEKKNLIQTSEIQKSETRKDNIVKENSESQNEISENEKEKLKNEIRERKNSLKTEKFINDINSKDEIIDSNMKKFIEKIPIQLKNNEKNSNEVIIDTELNNFIENIPNTPRTSESISNNISYNFKKEIENDFSFEHNSNLNDILFSKNNILIKTGNYVNSQNISLNEIRDFAKKNEIEEENKKNDFKIFFNMINELKEKVQLLENENKDQKLKIKKIEDIEYEQNMEIKQQIFFKDKLEQMENKMDILINENRFLKKFVKIIYLNNKDIKENLKNQKFEIENALNTKLDKLNKKILLDKNEKNLDIKKINEKIETKLNVKYDIREEKSESQKNIKVKIKNELLQREIIEISLKNQKIEKEKIEKEKIEKEKFEKEKFEKEKFEKEKIEMEKIKNEKIEIEKKFKNNYTIIKEYIKLDNNFEEVKNFILKKRDEISLLNDENSLLFYSINSNNFEITFFLINEKYTFKENEFKDYNEKKIYEKIIDIYNKNKNKKKEILEKEILKFCFENGILEIFKNLTKKKNVRKSSLYETNFNQKNPLEKIIKKFKFLISKKSEKNSEIIEFLINQEDLNTKDIDQNNFLHILLKKKITLEKLIFLLNVKNEKFFKNLLFEKNIEEENPFHIACYSDQNENIIEFLFKITGKEILEKTDKFGNTPLHFACLKNRFKVIKFLYDNNAYLFALNKFDFSCFDNLSDSGKEYFCEIRKNKLY